MRFAICDDEMSCLREYGNIITAILRDNNIAADVALFSNCRELMFALEGEKEDDGIDVVFLDISMPDMNGIEMARWICRREIKCEIIFLTVSRQQAHMLDAFDVGAFHYVIKDHTSREKLEEICVRVAERVEKGKREVITASCAGEVRVIPVRSILYFEVNNYIIIVHYDDQVFEFYSTLGKIENSLLGHGFVRVHRSFLVNRYRIHKVMRQELELSNGEKVPVGRKYLDDLRRLVQPDTDPGGTKTGDGKKAPHA